MTQDEIIAMAKEAGFRIGQMDTLEGSRTLVKHASFDCLAELTRFAALVAEKEREACAQVCDGFDTGRRLTTDFKAAEMATAIRARVGVK